MTGMLRAKVAGSWVDIAGVSGEERWNTAWGIIASTIPSPTPFTPAANATVVAASLTAKFVAGRRYRLVGNVRAIGAAGYSVAIRVGSTDSFMVQTDMYTWVTGNYASLHIESIVGGDGGTHTINLSIINGAGTTYFYMDTSSCTFYIEDVGPASQAAIQPSGTPPVLSAGNAIGVVAMGICKSADIAAAANVITPVTEILNFTPQVGRRYRLVCRIRAVSGITNGQLTLTGTNSIPAGDVWSAVGIAGHNTNMWYEVVFDGTGQPSTYQVYAKMQQACTIYCSPSSQVVNQFYIEDVGPNTAPAATLPETPPAWIPMALKTGWAIYGGGFYAPSYRRLGDIVWMKGLLSAGVGVTAAITTLPAGFRPLDIQILTLQQSATPFVARIDVNPDGTIGINPALAPVPAAGQWVAFPNVSFSAV